MSTYFIDTNYFLRLFLKDNSHQFKKVYSLFQQAIEQKVILMTSTIVFFEIYWVLSSFYKKNKQKCSLFLQKLLAMEFVEIENKEILIQALKLFQKTALELEDCYNIAYYQNNSLDNFSTFDKKITKFLK